MPPFQVVQVEECLPKSYLTRFCDLFVGCTVNQVMAEATYAAIEYAYLQLQTKLVAVLGHSSCGAVGAAIKRFENPPGHVVTLVNAIKSAPIQAKKIQGDTLENAVRQNVINQVNVLRQLELILSRAYEKAICFNVGAVYDLASGKVEFLKDPLENLPKTDYAKAK